MTDPTDGLDPSAPPEPPISPDSLDTLVGRAQTVYKVEQKEVYKVVKEINVSKSSGIENISSLIIKEAFKTILPQVTFMYNLSVRSSCFPDAWKKALVVPI